MRDLSELIKKSKKIILSNNKIEELTFMKVKGNYLYFWGTNKKNEIIIIEVNKMFYETDHHFLELEGHFWKRL